MKITYRNEFRDLLRFNLHHLPRTAAFILTVAGLIIVHAWSFLPSARALDGGNAMKMFVYMVTLVALLGALVVVQFVVVLVSYRPSKNRAVLTEHVIHVDDQGILEETEFGSTRTTWVAVPKVTENRDYIFLYVQEHMAHLIPKRAFASRAEAADFFSYATSRVAASRRR